MNRDGEGRGRIERWKRECRILRDLHLSEHCYMDLSDCIPNLSILLSRLSPSLCEQLVSLLF